MSRESPMMSPGGMQAHDSGEDSDDATSVAIARQDRLYDQLISQCGGQLLAVMFILLIYGAWTLLQDYRDAILWALICSVTLRDLKVYLTNHALIALDTERSLAFLCVSVLCSPIRALQQAAKEVLDFLKRWRQYTVAYEEQWRLDKQSSFSRSQSIPVDSGAGAAKQRANVADDESSHVKPPTRQTKSTRKRRRKSTLSGYLLGFFQVGQLGVKAYKGGKQKEQVAQSLKLVPKEAQSPPLLSALLIAIAIYQSSCWILSSWSSIRQLLALSSTVLASLLLLPFCYLVAHLFLSMSDAQRKPADPVKVQDGGHTDASNRGDSAFSKSTQKSSFLVSFRQTAVYRSYKKIDDFVKDKAAGAIHSIVAASLVLALVLGSTCLLIFMSVQIGQESGLAVRSVHEAARQWATIDPSSPRASGPVGGWLLGQQISIGHILQENLPAAAEWAESQVNSVVEAYNLTQVRDDMRALYATVVPARSCSNEQKQQHLITLARTSIDALQANSDHDTISDQIHQGQQRLQTATLQLEERLFLKNDGESSLDLIRDASEAVIECDRHLRDLQRLHLPAHQKRDETAEKEKIARESLQRCMELRRRPVHGGGSDRLQQLSLQLGEAYNQFWGARFEDGIKTLQAVLSQVVSAGTKAVQGHGLNTLSRIAKAAAEPLVALSQSSAKVLASSTYSGTLLALTSGLGVFRLGIGILKSAVQMVVFLALLFYLLAAETDPVAAVFQIFPLSRVARVRVSQSIEQSMRGVLVAACKLALFHALFTWLTFRMFDVHLVYLSSLASAVFASIPFIPSWLVALPAAAQLLLIQDRLIAAVGLLGAHLLAWYIADDIILREIPSTHPYITGLGIFGGIATFSNPLQGAIFGPMALSVLSVAYNLHAELVLDSAAPIRSNRSSGLVLQEYSQ